MENRNNCCNLRQECGKLGLALLVYYGIMNVMVLFAAIADAVGVALHSMGAAGEDRFPAAVMDEMMDAIQSNGWGYILAVAIGSLLMLAWKKGKFCFREIWKTDRPMTPGSFLCLLCIFVSGQALFQILAVVIEMAFNRFGISIMDAIQSASVTGDTLSMFLYLSLFAPVFEEILFRGLILRALQPYGKKFAILASAFLFGIFHGNIVQSPYAFAVGLLLGYVAVEYSMGWSMVLHMINNLVLGDSLGRITQTLPLWQSELIFSVIVWGCALAAAIIFIVRRREVSAYWKDGKIHPLCLKSFFTAPTILVLTGLMGFNMLLSLLMQMLV